MPTEGQRRSRRQERRIAADHGGKVTPQSGAGWRAKNDVRTDTESWEAKTTSGSQFTLKLTELLTAWTQAIVDHRRMVFEIEFGNRKRFVVLDGDDYIELRDSLDQHFQRAESLGVAYRLLVTEMVQGLSSAEHDMAMVAGLPQCQCGHSLAGGKASESFIAHALAVRAGA